MRERERVGQRTREGLLSRNVVCAFMDGSSQDRRRQRRVSGGKSFSPFSSLSSTANAVSSCGHWKMRSVVAVTGIETRGELISASIQDEREHAESQGKDELSVEMRDEG